MLFRWTQLRKSSACSRGKGRVNPAPVTAGVAGQTGDLATLGRWRLTPLFSGVDPARPSVGWPPAPTTTGGHGAAGEKWRTKRQAPLKKKNHSERRSIKTKGLD